MKSFAEFLTESKTNWSLADFKETLKSTADVEEFDRKGSDALAGRYLPRLIEFLNAHATGDVPNPVYVNVKDTANRAVEFAFNFPAHIYAIVRANRNIDSYAVSGITSTYVVPGKLKLAEKQAAKTTGDEKVFWTWALSILREWAPVAAAMENMKSRAVKRQPKPAEDRHEKYIAPMAKHETGQLILKALRSITDEIKGKYAARILRWMTEEAEQFAALSDEQQNAKGVQPPQLPNAIWDMERDSKTFNVVRSLKPTYKATLKKEADEQAEDMQQEFVFKNAKKLGSIIDAKGVGLTNEPKAHNIRVESQAFSGELHFIFADGSSFTVRNKVVWKVNQYRTVFRQYPTTFHDVVLPDGKPMPSPSEERMNTVWAVTK